MRACIALLAAALALAAWAQQGEPANSVFLVAKPNMVDPNFSQTVVLVTQTPDGGTVGVIINRPTPLKLSQLLSDEFETRNYRDPIFFGGPVMRQAIVALFHADAAPPAPAFHVLKGLYLTMHPDNIKPLLAEPGRRYRLYAGFSGWAPRQLESEFNRDGWFVVSPDEGTVFSKDTAGLWEEMVRRAQTRPVNVLTP
jgi:putative transcriptional regulator